MDIRAIEQLSSRLAAEGKAELQHAGAEEYFRTLNPAALPVYSRSLHHSMQGCYSSQVRVKQENRRLENQLAFCKAIGSAAQMNGAAAYPRETIERATRDLCFAQFHDLLPGSSIRDVEEMGLRLMSHARHELSEARARIFFALSQGQKKAEEGTIPILVFNPHPYEMVTEVDCEFMLADQNQDHRFAYVARVYGEDGAVLPSQMEKERSNVNFDWRKRVVFRAKLAPSSMNRFTCRLEKQAMAYGPMDWRGHPYQPSVARRTENLVFANDEREVAISPATGRICSYKVAGQEMLAGEAGVLEWFADTPDPWGMDGIRVQDPVDRFVLADDTQTQRICGVEQPIPAVRIVEDGEVRTVVEAVFVCGRSDAVVTYTIPRKGSFVDIHIRLLVNEKDRLLKASFPLALEEASVFSGEDIFGIARLDKAEGEQPIHQWAALSDGVHAGTVLNDGVYAADCRGNDLRVTLLRTPAYTAHPTDDHMNILPRSRYTPRCDQGEREFRLRFACGPAADRMERVTAEAAAFNMPPYALSFFPSGEAAPPKPGVCLSDPAVQLSCVQPLSDGGYLLRLFNPGDQPRTVTVTIPALGFAGEASLPAGGVETYLCEGGRLLPADMLGRKQEEEKQ